MADSAREVRQTVVWLEDDPDEDRVTARKEEIEALGYNVVVARGFRELEKSLRARLPGGEHRDMVCLLVIDIMIDGVNNLSAYFPWVEDARTANGFAAGLVFLDRVLAPEHRSSRDTVFGHFDAIPVIVYSNRAMPKTETRRLDSVKSRRAGPIVVLEKGALDKFVQSVNSLVSAQQTNE